LKRTNVTDFAFHVNKSAGYPAAPFHPDYDYPEFGSIFRNFDETNSVYRSIRQLFIASGYDHENLGTPHWNPFRGYIEAGQAVIIKPNLVYHETGELKGTNCLTTHASVIRPLIDYLFLLQRQDRIIFKITIADVPLQSADFERIITQNGLRSIRDFYRSAYHFDLDILDLRHEIAQVDQSGFMTKIRVAGDPLGYSVIMLKKSFLDEIIKDYRKFSLSGYDATPTKERHRREGEHYYHIPNTILAANLFINVPKLKTHQKAGITIALKNLVGINGDKSWVPHYRLGSKSKGGDEFSNVNAWYKLLNSRTNRLLQGKSRILWRFARKINQVVFKNLLFRLSSSDHPGGQGKFKNSAKRFIGGGAWYGNDTIWRPILDLNHLLFFYKKNGKETPFKARKYLCVTDGVVAGEGDGPLQPTPKHIGITALSQNPLINDLCLSRMMGFDWEKIPQLKRAKDMHPDFTFTGEVANLFPPLRLA